MSWLTSCLLYIVHAVYYLFNLASSLRRTFASKPNPLTVKRKQVPTHLALLLASDEDGIPESLEQHVLENVLQVVAWCRSVGIARLTLYDRQGLLHRSQFSVRQRLYEDKQGCDAEQEQPEYPLTPPPSDDSTASSRSLSPDGQSQPALSCTTISVSAQPKKARRDGKGVVRRRVAPEKQEPSEPPFTLHLTSRTSGKPAAAELARSIANTRSRSNEKSTLSVNEVKSILEGEYGFPQPDLMMIHHVTPQRRPKHVLEFHGFPPWQMSLTEFFYTEYPSAWWNSWRRESRCSYVPLTEEDVCRALDQFSSAEMRLGK